MYDLLHISMEPWGPVWRRNQNIAAGFAKRFPDRKVLYVAPASDLSHAVRKGRWRSVGRNWRAAPPVPAEGYPNVFLFTPVKPFPNTVLPCRLLNQALERKQIRKAAALVGLGERVLYINPYYAAHMPGRMGEQAVVYDLGDDWTAFEQPTGLARRIVRDDRRLTERSDAVIVVSNRLLEIKEPWKDKLHLIPNGVDVEKYAQVKERALPPHPLTLGWPRPVLGHTGTLQAQRSDVDFIVELARRFPTGTIALVGPNDLDAESTGRLQAEPNIRVTGAVPYDEVPRVMSAFDVCIVPHRVTPFSDSQCPLKLFEYLASGLPIVATRVNGFRDYPELIHLANDVDAFADGVRSAMTEGEDSAARRRALAAKHTWAARVDAFAEVLEGLKRPVSLVEHESQLRNLVPSTGASGEGLR